MSVHHWWVFCAIAGGIEAIFYIGVAIWLIYDYIRYRLR